MCVDEKALVFNYLARKVEIGGPKRGSMTGVDVEYRVETPPERKSLPGKKSAAASITNFVNLPAWRAGSQ